MSYSGSDTQEGNWIARYVRQTPISWESHRLSGERISLLFWKFSFYRAFYEMIFPKRKLFNSANSIGCERTRFSYAENFAQIVGLSYFSFKTKKSPIVWTATHPFPISFPLANISSSVKIRTNLKVHNFLKICSKFYHLRCTNLALHIVSNLPFSGGRRNHDESKLLVGSVANVTQPWEVI